MLRKIALPLAGLLLVSLACSFTNDVQKAVETINKSAELLQEIADSGTFTYIGDGMEALDTQAGGFASTISMTEGTADATGAAFTEITGQTTWTIITDEQGDTRATVLENDNRYEFINVEDKTYRVVDGGYRCMAYREGEQWYQVPGDETGIEAVQAREIFDGYGALAAGLAAFSVAEKGESTTINGVATTQYNLVSKLQEAKDILSEFPSDDLQTSLNEAPEFYVSGMMYIADDSKALMRYEAQYANLDTQTGNLFQFEVTELGNQPDVTAPDAAQITVPCSGGTPVEGNS